MHILTLKEVVFADSKIFHLARIYFRKLASSKYFAGISFREFVLAKNFRGINFPENVQNS